MVDKVTPFPGASSKIFLGGTPVVAIYGGAIGGRVRNPLTAGAQGISVAEPLFYSFLGDAGVSAGVTTSVLQPGQSIQFPAGMTANLSVNAATTGHKFSSFAIQPAIEQPVAFTGSFPPLVTSSLAKTIRAYPYQQYADDDDIQAFFASYNSLQQEYVDWFNNAGLAVYTGPLIAGSLLDWIAAGIYGMQRPTLSSGRNPDLGPLNTAQYNEVEYNESKRIGPQDVTVTSDDIFKRIMTWRLYKGDGKTFNVFWLKRRIMRFLTFPNGTSGNIDNTYAVSVAFSGTQINILLPGLPNATILKEAIDSGVCELPFQYKFAVTIAT